MDLRSAFILCLLITAVMALPYSYITFKFKGSKPVKLFDQVDYSPSQFDLEKGSERPGTDVRERFYGARSDGFQSTSDDSELHTPNLPLVRRLL
ncbi:hypothetical protein QR680_006723 [Steinernema hermaphroditum]|uniref:Uncharacterized protein n=1 Tax=Steinernema hermaphroditum TaxID=289476 RepID=A0AA39HWA4_9BILA|nr:hypothetical protein QR680_006723 [Steinernema hermaphroditum]